jgi:hypothetical protein
LDKFFDPRGKKQKEEDIPREGKDVVEGCEGRLT